MIKTELNELPSDLSNIFKQRNLLHLIMILFTIFIHKLRCAVCKTMEEAAEKDRVQVEGQTNETIN